MVSHTKANDPSRHRHHPEHAIDGYSMRGCREDASNDDHQSREDNGSLSTEVVAGQAV